MWLADCYCFLMSSLQKKNSPTSGTFIKAAQIFNNIAYTLLISSFDCKKNKMQLYIGYPF
jgi:hypothetical protein